MLGLKLNHVSKRGHRYQNITWNQCFIGPSEQNVNWNFNTLIILRFQLIFVQTLIIQTIVFGVTIWSEMSFITKMYYIFFQFTSKDVLPFYNHAWSLYPTTPRFNIMISCSLSMKSHCGKKTILRCLISTMKLPTLMTCILILNPGPDFLPYYCTNHSMSETAASCSFQWRRKEMSAATSWPQGSKSTWGRAKGQTNINQYIALTPQCHQDKI